MKKSVLFRLSDEEFKSLEDFCKATDRTKSDVLREFVRTLKIKSKPS